MLLSDGKYGSYGYLKEDNPKPRVFSGPRFFVVAGIIPRFDRLLVAVADKEPRIEHDFLTRELLVSKDEKNFLFLEDPAMRYSDNHAIWHMRIGAKEVKVEKVFDAHDKKLGGSATPNISEDGAFGLRWLPRQEGALFFSSAGGIYSLQVIHFLPHGYRRTSQVLENQDDIPGAGDELEWLDEHTCRFKNGKRHLRLPRGGGREFRWK